MNYRTAFVLETVKLFATMTVYLFITIWTLVYVLTLTLTMNCTWFGENCVDWVSPVFVVTSLPFIATTIYGVYSHLNEAAIERLKVSQKWSYATAFVLEIVKSFATMMVYSFVTIWTFVCLLTLTLTMNCTWLGESCADWVSPAFVVTSSPFITMSICNLYAYLNRAALERLAADHAAIVVDAGYDKL